MCVVSIALVLIGQSELSVASKLKLSSFVTVAPASKLGKLSQLILCEMMDIGKNHVESHVLAFALLTDLLCAAALVHKVRTDVPDNFRQIQLYFVQLPQKAIRINLLQT